MQYTKITNQYISNLKIELKIFFDNVRAEVNRQEREDIENARKEAYDDKYYGRYETISVDDWLYGIIDDVSTWAYNQRKELDLRYLTATRVIEEAKNKRFYSTDLGYEFEISLFDGKIIKTRTNPFEDDTLYVYFSGIDWDVDGVYFSFEPDEVEYDDWDDDLLF